MLWKQRTLEARLTHRYLFIWTASSLSGTGRWPVWFWSGFRGMALPLLCFWNWDWPNGFVFTTISSRDCSTRPRGSFNKASTHIVQGFSYSLSSFSTWLTLRSINSRLLLSRVLSWKWLHRNASTTRRYFLPVRTRTTFATFQSWSGSRFHLLPLQGFFERLVVFLGDIPTCNSSYMAMKPLSVSNLPTISFKMASIAELMNEWLGSLFCLQCSRMLWLTSSKSWSPIRVRISIDGTCTLLSNLASSMWSSPV